SPMEFAEYLVRTHLQAYGITNIKQITHLRKGKNLRNNVQEVLQNMLEEKTIQQLNIEGMRTAFVQTTLLENTVSKPTATIRFLSPFDNSIIHRERVLQLFNFD